MKKNLFLIYTFFFFLTTSAVIAREPYHVAVTVDTTTAKVSAPNLLDLQRELRTTSLEELIPIYTPVSPVSFDYNFRELIALASFAANSTTLVVDFPNEGISETFTGSTRDESLQLFKEFMRDGNRQHKLLKAYAKRSPIDPIAGNPNSLMAVMAESDYQLGRLYPLRGCHCNCITQPVLHEFQFGVSFVRGFSEGYETSSATLPTRYSYAPYRRWSLILDAPITYNKNGGASSILGSLGIGLQYFVKCNWSLTPILRLGSGGSLDLCTGAGFLSSGLTSVYDIRTKPGVFSIINYAGYISSINLWVSGLNLNYQLHNFIFKNGFVFTFCKGQCLWGRNHYLTLFFEDTAFTRDHLYMMHYDEVGASLVVSGVNKRLCWDNLILGFSYQFGEREYEGYRFNFVYQF